MANYKAGLQRKVSSIFDGVSIPGADAATQPGIGPTDAPTADPGTSVPPAPDSPGPAEPSTSSAAVARNRTDIIARGGKPPSVLHVWKQIEQRLFPPKPGVNPVKQKVMTVLIPVLFMVLVFVLVKVFGAPSGPSSRNAETGAQGHSATADCEGEIHWPTPAPYPATLSDPTQMTTRTTQKAQTQTLAVKGIVYTEDNPFAIIGARIVRTGEKVSGVTVVKINKNSVEFEKDGKRWTQQVR